MARPKKIKDFALVEDVALVEATELNNAISPIEITFSNGDDNLLKEKINELIARLNG